MVSTIVQCRFIRYIDVNSQPEKWRIMQSQVLWCVWTKLKWISSIINATFHLLNEHKLTKSDFKHTKSDVSLNPASKRYGKNGSHVAYEDKELSCVTASRPVEKLRLCWQPQLKVSVAESKKWPRFKIAQTFLLRRHAKRFSSTQHVHIMVSHLALLCFFFCFFFSLCGNFRLIQPGMSDVFSRWCTWY